MAVPQCLLGPLALGDIFHDAEDKSDFAVRPQGRGRRGLSPTGFTVLSKITLLHREARDLASQELLDKRDGQSPVFRIGKVTDVPPNQFLWAVTAHAAEGTVGFGDDAITHANDHSHRRFLESDPETLLARCAVPLPLVCAR